MSIFYAIAASAFGCVALVVEPLIGFIVRVCMLILSDVARVECSQQQRCGVDCTRLTGHQDEITANKAD
jgi:hypothetical protein